jgi:GT2 family glycosyltransferase
MNRAEMPMSSRDVEDCFTLILGRVPDAEALARCANTPFGVVLAELLSSPEFQTAVLSPLLLRESLPQERFAPTPSLRLVDWVQRRIPIEPAARAAAGAARLWVPLLELLLADSGLVALAPNLMKAGIDRVFRERLEKQPIGKITRAVIGAIDSASSLELRGWAVDLCDKAMPVTLEFYADNLFIGSTTCVEPRPDVKEAVGGEGHCGFTFRIPTARRDTFIGGRILIAIDAVSRERVGVSTTVHADLTQGLDILSATRQELASLREILLRIEARLPDLGRLASVPLEAYGDYFRRFYTPAADTLSRQRAISAAFPFRPLVSVVLPTWNSGTRILEEAIESVRAQTYDRWELIITDDATPGDEFQQFLERHAADPRIRCVYSDVHSGIAANTNRGIAAARGDYVAFLDHDDQLAPDALFTVVGALQDRRYGLIYSDEDRIEVDASGELVHHSPFFKPGFDPELLRSMNYICHLAVMRRDVLTACGGLSPGCDGAQDHDLLLRATEHLPADEVRHTPRILYHWRVTDGSVSRTAASAAELQRTMVAVVQRHLDRARLDATAESHADPFGRPRAFATRIRWRLPTSAPRVSVIIPTRDRLDLLRPCVASVLRHAPRYPGELDLVIVDNDSAAPDTATYFSHLAREHSARIIRWSGEFNWSAINNMAAHQASGEVLIFLNNDTVVLAEDWCAEITANALRPDVGAVGGRLLYDDGTLQHAGVVLGVEGVAGHDSVGESPERGGYFGRSHLQRSAAAVTGACLATRRSVFDEVGGFDAIHLKVAFNDVDYCLRLQKAGYRVVYDPHVVLYHFESKSRGYDLSESKLARQRAEAATFRARWRAIVDEDPFYNAHFERHARPFDRLRAPP